MVKINGNFEKTKKKTGQIASSKLATKKKSLAKRSFKLNG